MNAAHQMIELGKASAGMVLSDAILDRQGQVLLPAGTVLTHSTIAALARHDVAMLPIAIAGESKPQLDAAAITARLAHLFRGDGADIAARPDTGPAATANALLHHYIADYRLERTVAP